MKPLNSFLNNKAAVWTAGVHAALLLLFMLYSFTLTTELPQEELGIEVNLGTSDDGFGSNQPLMPGDPAAASSSISQRDAAQSAATEKEIEQNDEPDAPEVSLPRPAERRNNNPTAVNNTNNRNNRNPAAHASNATARRRLGVPLYNGQGGNQSPENIPGGSEGNTTGDGDRGNINGNPNSTNYDGNGGRGNSGMSYRLAGRSLVGRPSLQAEYREGGRVTLFITVNRDGAIIASRIKRTPNAELGAIAMRKIRDVRFNKSTNAPVEQSGDFIFDFTTRRTN